MGRTKEQNAAYQRDYRARQKLGQTLAERVKPLVTDYAVLVTEYQALYDDTARERDVLIEEVARLKRQLAARPSAMAPAGEMHPVVAEPIGHAFNSRPFTPVPRKRE